MRGLRLTWAVGSALVLCAMVWAGAAEAQPASGVSPSETKQVVWQDNVAVIGAGAADPPAAQVFQAGTLFWRTDLQAFRYYAAGAWQTLSAFTTPLLGPAYDNCATPPYSFQGDPTTGLCSSADGVVHLRSNGVNVFSVSGTALTSTVPILGTSANFVGPLGLGNTTAAPNVFLRGDAANALTLRNGGTDGAPAPQSLILHNFCDGADCATGYEKLSLDWSSEFVIQTMNGGTGDVMSITLRPSNYLLIQPAGGFTIVSGVLESATDDNQMLGRAPGVKAWQGAYFTRSIQGSKSCTLTETVATTCVTVTVPQTAGANFTAGKVGYTIYESDGTDTTTIEGEAKFNCANKAGTEGCAAIADVQTAAYSTSGTDTLTCVITAVTGLVDSIGLAANCTDAGTMTQTTLKMLLRLDMPQANTLAFP